MKTFVTSDLHLFHNRDFIYEPRGFPSVEEMNETIVQNWNSIVSPIDDCYILGDLMLNDNEAGIRYLNRLNGRLHIVIGNHDTRERIDMYKYRLKWVSEVEYAIPMKYHGYRFYLSHYPTITDNFDFDKPLTKRTINLCGHSHCKDPFQDMGKGLIFHCDLDAHNNFPIELDNVIEDIKKKI